jgi:CheY-like chemotaxis protein
MNPADDDVKRVWVAEDDPDFREMLAEVLRWDGFDVTEFESGMGFVGASRSEPKPALIVTDHHMPGLDGLDALEQLRQDGCVVPSVLVTAFAEVEVKERAHRVGAVLVEKPCDIYELRRIIRERLTN